MMEQGSQLWLEFRRTRVGSSDSSAIMGVDPYKTAYELYLEKTDPNFTPYVNAAMREGTRREPIVREWYSKRTGQCFVPVVAICPLNNLIHSSIDGMNFNWDECLEIKGPGKPTFDKIVKEGIPKNYYCQCQHHMLVTGLGKVTFLPWIDENNFLIEFVQRDQEYIDELYKKICAFLTCLETNTPPERSESDHRIRADKIWYEAKLRYENALARQKQADEDVTRERDLLISLSEDQSTKGCGLTCTKYERRGSIEFLKVKELQGIDLEPYRKPSTTSWRITMENDNG